MPSTLTSIDGPHPWTFPGNFEQYIIKYALRSINGTCSGPDHYIQYLISLRMLTVWKVSGGKWTIPFELATDVKTLKECLQYLCGASRFRQRILHDGIILDESRPLFAQQAVQLVVLPFSVDSGGTQLAQLEGACWDGNISQVEELLRSRLDPNPAIEDFEASPLYAASNQGHTEIVRLLLDATAEVDLMSHGRWTALMVACRGGWEQIVSLLLEAEANVDLAETNRAWTALMNTAYCGCEATARLLLGAAADLHLKNRHGLTALAIAAGNGHRSMVFMLLQARAFMDVADAEDKTALVVALDAGYTGVVSTRANKDAADTNGANALMYASAAGNVEVVRLLLQARAGQDFRDNSGWTALLHAASKGNEQTSYLLLDAGADHELASSGGETPLWHASFQGRVEIVRLLLKAAACPNTPNACGQTPLWAACATHQACVVDLLLEANAGRRQIAWTGQHGTHPMLQCHASSSKLVDIQKSWQNDVALATESDQ